MLTSRATSRRRTHPVPPPSTGTLLTAQERAARRQAEQARAALRLARCQRIQAANDAVSAYMRTSGTRDYRAAFNHIERTRPELFADMQVPAHHRIAAGNFNPYHDQLGRFTTSGDAVAPHGGEHQPDAGVHRPDFAGTSQTPRLNYTEEPTQQQGGQTQVGPASKRFVNSIRDRAWDSQNDATCSAVGLRTLIATAKGQSKEAAPTLEDIKSKIEAEARKLNPQIAAAIDKDHANVKDPAKKLRFFPITIDWKNGGVRAQGEDYAALMQNVLSQYGVKSTVRQGYDPKTRITMQELADTLVAKGTPAMLNLGENPSNEHAVTVQWDPSAGHDRKGRFLVNIIAQGGTREFTSSEFKSGILRDKERKGDRHLLPEQ